MSDDRRLLEDAARAAGIEYEWTHDGFFGGTVGVRPKNWMRCWNPLQDDADALRLAVRLQLRVIPPEDEFGLDRASVRVAGFRDLVDAFDADPYTATRQAITRAAAELWRAQQEASK